MEPTIVKLYNEGLTQTEITKSLSICLQTVRKILIKNDIVLRIYNPPSQKKYHYDETFFDNIDTQEKAYILGLLYADGWVSKRNNLIAIQLQERDSYILDDINKCMKSNVKLQFVKKQKENYQNTIRLSFYGEQLFNSIVDHGVLINKTSFIEYPKINKELNPHFIRGVFDGDGCITIGDHNPTFSIIGFQPFMKQIQNVLIEDIGLNLTKLYINKGKYKCDIATLSYCGRKNLIKIGEYLYKDDTISLKRKKEKFLELIDWKRKIHE